MAVSFQSVEDSDLSEAEAPIFNVLRATLQYPADPQLKGVKLADDLSFFFKAEGTAEIGWDVWRVFIEVVSCIPHNHSWQESLLHALNHLRQRDTPVSDSPDEHVNTQVPALWKELPYLAWTMREQWNDPFDIGEGLPEKISQWKNLNSFVARLTSAGFAPWLTFPIWQLREALETPPVKGAQMDCRLWVASEWVVHCAGLLFEISNSKEEFDNDTTRALQPGSLYNDAQIKVWSAERWSLWKKRFSEIIEEAETLNLDTTTTDHISEAQKSMAKVDN
ncbi:hypothetical protein TruAng_008445 [Truncatella angustata]|nr:hypothetical protein TruAng_008445 [Truncatella angustata]